MTEEVEEIEVEEISKAERGRPKKRYSKERVMEAIDNSNGTILDISKRLGIHRETVKRNIEFHDLGEYLEGKVEDLKDMAMANVAFALEIGDLPTSRWFLNRTVYSDRNKKKSNSKIIINFN